MRRCGRPISASRRGSVMADAPLLELTAIETCYGREPGAVRRVARDRAGRDGDADGPQRHGQDHDGALDHGADAGDAPARSASTARRSAGCRPTGSPSSASGWCRRAGRCFPTSPRARTWSRPPPTAAMRADPWTLGQGLRAVSAARRAHRQHGQPALRRRAADAGDRPRADDQSAPAHPRRGDRGAGAADPRRDLAVPRRGSRPPASRSW